VTGTRGRTPGLAVAAALLVATAGCTTSVAPSPASPTSAGAGGLSSTSPASGPEPGTASPSPALGRSDLSGDQQALDALLAAGTAGDRKAWDAAVSDADPAFASRSAELFTNVSTLPLERLRLRLTGTTAALDDARRATLGADARVLQARLSWRLPHETADATSTVWLTLVGGPDGDRLAGTADGSALDAPAQPLWWLGPATAARWGDATALVGPGQDAARWAALAERAAAAVERHLPRPLGKDWDGRVVVQVPGSAGDFAQVLGASPTAYARTAAVTRPEGPTTAAALRVVVNPAAGTGTDDELGLLLTHETVHVATRSAASPAPLWAVEGLAEHVALAAHPDQRADELAALRGQDPAALPPDDAFDADARDVTAAYAQAWLACRAVADRRGQAGLGRLYAALDDGDPLDEAARSALGVDGATVARWARGERRDAGATG
jgi:hypothetical protein